jgi:hypothetical protein
MVTVSLSDPHEHRTLIGRFTALDEFGACVESATPVGGR